MRERAKARGHDPIFPPEPKPLEFPDRGGLNLSGLQTMQLMEGNIPDGYELVKVEELDELRRRAGRASDGGAAAGLATPGGMHHRGAARARDAA